MKLINLVTKKQFHIMLLENIDFNLSFFVKNLMRLSLNIKFIIDLWGFIKVQS